MAIDLNELATALGQIILRFRVRRRTAADWASINEVLLSAEIGLESDSAKFKFGDGVTPWETLLYPKMLHSVVAGTNVTVDNTDPNNPIISATGGSGGGSDIDAPPAVPTAWDDEFDFGTVVDTTGARRAGANAWVIHSANGTTGTETIESSLLVASYGAATGTRLILQPVPTGDYSFTVKAHYTGVGAWGCPALCLYNASTGNIVFIQFFQSPTLVFQRGTINTSTFAYTFSLNPFTSSLRPATTWGYLRLKVTNSGTPTIHASVSETGLSFDFAEFYSEAVSAWVGTPTHIGLFNNAPTSGMLEYFRRTA